MQCRSYYAKTKPGLLSLFFINLDDKLLCLSVALPLDLTQIWLNKSL